MFKGIDCATRLNADTCRRLVAMGYSFAGRYCVPQDRAKALTLAEVKAIHGAGLGILLCWELTAARAQSGAAVGKADGAAAAECARKLGAPKETILYMAVDYDAPEKDYGSIAAYLHAAGEAAGGAGYRIGVYGHYGVIEAMHRRGVCAGYWQCVAWSYGLVSDFLNVYQYEWQQGEEAQRLSRKIGHYVDINSCRDMRLAGIWEDKMSGEEIYRALQEYCEAQPLPEWARAELEEAKELGITDGSRPMEPIPRYQAAIMALRAVKAAREGAGA